MVVFTGVICSGQTLLAVRSRFPVFGTPEILGILSHPFMEDTIIIRNNRGVYEVNVTDCVVLVGNSGTTTGTDCHTSPHSIFESSLSFHQVDDMDILMLEGTHSLLLTSPSRHCIEKVEIDSKETEVFVKRYLGRCDASGEADGAMDHVRFNSPLNTLVKTEIGISTSLWIRTYWTHPTTHNVMQTICDISTALCTKEEAISLHQPLQVCVSSFHDMVSVHSVNKRLEIQTGNIIITVTDICMKACVFHSDTMYRICGTGLLHKTDLQTDVMTGSVESHKVKVQMAGHLIHSPLKFLEINRDDSLITYSADHQLILELSHLFCYRTDQTRGHIVSTLHIRNGDCGASAFYEHQTLNLNSCVYSCVASGVCNSVSFDKMLGVCKLHRCYKQQTLVTGDHLICMIIRW